MLVIMPKAKKPEFKADKVFAELCYRGVHYTRWVVLNSIPNQNWSIDL